MKKKSPKIDPSKTSWTFDIGKEDYTKDLKPFKPVLLDKKVIYKIDKTKVYGDIERNQTKEVLEALKKETGIEFTKEQLQRAITLGILEK
jgi:hypothetical protein